MPGIVDASTVNTVPLSGSGRNSYYSQEAGKNPAISLLAAEYFFDDHFLDASGVKLIEGVNFKHEDMNYIPASGEKVSYTKVIITKAFAEATFGKEQGSYIGKHLYSGDLRALTIIGVVETLQAPWPTASFIEHSIIIPLNYNSRYQRFMIRTETGKRDQIIPAVVESLRARNPHRIIREPKSFTQLRYDSYRDDMAMNSILTAIVFILMTVTSFGIVGLVSFNVNQRKKQIGTRRALGARKIDIILYFMTENWLMTTIGLLIGSVMTYLLNYWLVEMYSVQKIDWYYLPLGILTLLLLGQLAVFFPARRAASISPAIATRSV
jgi:putative ABC transport system permease protein